MNAIAPLAAPDIRIADLTDAAACARLDAFVAEHPLGSMFHRPQWSRAVERGCGQRACYLVAEQSGAVAGVLPLSEIRSPLFGHALVSAGFATGGGLLTDGERIAERLAEAAWTLAQRHGCGAVELRGGPLPKDWIPHQGLYSGFDRTLPADAEALLASIPRRQRAEIRRGVEAGLVTSAGADSAHRDAHFRVYAESVRNLGTPVFPRRLFAAMLDAFPGEADITAVWNDGRPVAAHLNFYFKRSCQPYWGGGAAEARACRANDLGQYDLMARAIARGCTHADFGRSKVGTGPWQRKRNWGFVETPLVYGVRTGDGASPREINPLSPKYRLQIAAWKRLPLWFANSVGPVISRGLG